MPKLPLIHWGRADKILLGAVILFGLANLIINLIALT